MKKSKKKIIPKRKPAAITKAVALRKEPKSNLVRHDQVSSGLVKIRDINDPSMVLSFGKILQKYIKDNNLSVKIGNNDYAKVEAWQMAGSSFGLTAIPRKPVAKHNPGEYITTLYILKDFEKDGKRWKKEISVFVGYTRDQLIINDQRAFYEGKISREMTRPHFSYECECDIKRLSDGVLIGYGDGLCSNLEDSKSDFAEYAVNSQCQTRSIGKAYRSILAFVMKSAGVEPTPAEEMEDLKFREANIQVDSPKIRPVPTEDVFKSICKKMMEKKEVTVKVVKDNYTLTEDQEKALEIIDRTRKK